MEKLLRVVVLVMCACCFFCRNFCGIHAKLYMRVDLLCAPKHLTTLWTREKEGRYSSKYTVLISRTAPFPGPLNSERCLLIFAMLPECIILELSFTCLLPEGISSRMVWNEAEDPLLDRHTV
jgi:hypothetical protein